MKIMFLIVLVMILNGCSYHQSTFFRKHKASQEDERAAWAECGGEFFENDALKPLSDRRKLNCMKKKGFSTVNEYYEETLISWMADNNPKLVSWKYDDLDQCGGRKNSHYVCKRYHYVYSSDLVKINKCMGSKGYVASIPRNKVGVRVFRRGVKVPDNYCMFLTPKNSKGGVSLGGWRSE